MKRIPEPELMDDAEQARAFAEADFSEPHDHFVALLGERLPDLPREGRALDLGCGPADVTLRFAVAHPGFRIDGVDGAEAMLALGRAAIAERGLTGRVALHSLHLPAGKLPAEAYDLVFSNSLLHHLAEPAVLWSTIRQAARPGTHVFVMDLMRPETKQQAQQLVDTYARDEPEVLREDFYNSLLAAYRPDEVESQLRAAALPLQVTPVSDRHWIAWGKKGDAAASSTFRAKS